MSTLVVTVEASAARPFGSLPVLDGERVVGIIAETGLLRRIVRSDVCCADVETIVVSYP